MHSSMIRTQHHRLHIAALCPKILVLKLFVCFVPSLQTGLWCVTKWSLLKAREIANSPYKRRLARHRACGVGWGLERTGGKGRTCLLVVDGGGRREREPGATGRVGRRRRGVATAGQGDATHMKPWCGQLFSHGRQRSTFRIRVSCIVSALGGTRTPWPHAHGPRPTRFGANARCNPPARPAPKGAPASRHKVKETQP